jgi:hypothetical protein
MRLIMENAGACVIRIDEFVVHDPESVARVWPPFASLSPQTGVRGRRLTSTEPRVVRTIPRVVRIIPRVAFFTPRVA